MDSEGSGLQNVIPVCFSQNTIFPFYLLRNLYYRISFLFSNVGGDRKPPWGQYRPLIRAHTPLTGKLVNIESHILRCKDNR